MEKRRFEGAFSELVWHWIIQFKGMTLCGFVSNAKLAGRSCLFIADFHFFDIFM
jgi:hypothetical protein